MTRLILLGRVVVLESAPIPTSGPVRQGRPACVILAVTLAVVVRWLLMPA